ncbi:MAG: BsuPI-related putative proteinase inhibitor [Tumebacillaceae bacterium]
MLVIRTDKQTYRPDETVTMTLMWLNESPVQREYTFNNSQRFDILIEREGEKIWQWSDRRLFSQVYTTLLIAPGDSRLFKAEWNQMDSAGQPVPRGSYTIRAWIVRTEEAAETEVVLVNAEGQLPEREEASAAVGEAARDVYYHALSLHGYPMFVPEFGIPRALEAEFGDREKS